MRYFNRFGPVKGVDFHRLFTFISGGSCYWNGEGRWQTKSVRAHNLWNNTELDVPL